MSLPVAAVHGPLSLNVFMPQVEGLRPLLTVCVKPCALTNMAKLGQMCFYQPWPPGSLRGSVGSTGQFSASIEYPGLVSARARWVGSDATPGTFCSDYLWELCIPRPWALQVCSKSKKSLTSCGLETWKALEAGVKQNTHSTGKQTDTARGLLVVRGQGGSRAVVA